MSGNPHHIPTAVDAEVAYRQERAAAHFRPWRRVGAERRSRRGAPDGATGTPGAAPAEAPFRR